MGQSLGRQTGHSDEGNPWQRDMTDEGKQLSDEPHSGAQCGAPEDEGQQQLSRKRHRQNKIITEIVSGFRHFRKFAAIRA